MPKIVTCPDREILQRLMFGQIAGPQGEEFAQHLERCDRCTAMVETLGGEDTLVAAAQMSAAEEPQRAAVRDLIEWLRRFGPPDPGSPSPEDADTTADRLGDEHLDPSPPVASIRDYEVLEMIGHGGMGAVYKARHTRLKRIAALKLLPEGRTPSAATVRRFEREMEAVGKLKHPNIVHAYDAGEEGGRRYLVMEYLDGIDLSRLCKEHGPLRIADACEIIRQAALGLQHAHEHGLVHRDIKPSNLMLTAPFFPADGTGAGAEAAQPHVKVLDLGLALLREAAIGSLSASETPPPADEPPVASVAEIANDLTGAQLMGTCDYMAPEQASNSHAVGIRADIYSLGCTFYRLLVGHAPFETPEHDTPLRKLSAHSQTPSPSVRQHRPDVPEALAALLHRMLAKDAADRFASPAEVVEALRPWTVGCDLTDLLTGVPAEPKAESVRPAARGSSPPRRLRRLGLAAGGAAAIVLLGVAILVSMGKGAVKLEFADAEAARQCTVSVDGDAIRLENLGDPIKLWPGKHTLRVKHGGLEIETREFKVVRNGHEVLHVTLPTATREPGLAKNADDVRSARIHANRARECGLKGWWSEAKVAYSAAIQLDPTVAEYYLERGELHWTSGGPPNAPLADFSEAIRLDPHNADARVSRGAIGYKFGRLDEVASDFQAALRIDPDCVPRHFLRADAHRETYGRCSGYSGEYFKAVALHCALVEADPRNLEAALIDFRKLASSRAELVPAWLRWVSCWLPAVVRGKDQLPGIVFVSDMPWVRSTKGWGGDRAVRDTTWGGPVLLGPLPYWKGITTHPYNSDLPADVVIDVAGQRFAAFQAQVGAADEAGSVQYQVVVDGTVRHETSVLHLGELQSISVNVVGVKEIILRVLNGGDGADGDRAAWGLARFVKAGAEDPLEVPPAQLESATGANAAFFLAGVHMRLDHKDLARRWYDKAAEWMDKHSTAATQLEKFRAEAADALGISVRAPAVRRAAANPQ